MNNPDQEILDELRTMKNMQIDGLRTIIISLNGILVLLAILAAPIVWGVIQKIF